MSTVAPALKPPLAVPRRLLRLRSDAALAERFTAGDEAAFAVVYERYRPSVLAVCMGVLGSTHDAEDAAQDTFASLAAALRNAPPRELKPWLIRVARNAAIDVARRRKRTVVTDDELADVAVPAAGSARAELESVMAGIRELPENQRTALLMRELAGHTYLEIAALLEVDEEAVRGLIARARVSLRAHREASELSCAAARQSIATDPDGRELSKVVKRHVRECAPCRAYRQALREDARALRGLTALPTGASVVGGGAAFGGLAAKGALLGTAMTQVTAACAVSACAVGGVALLVPRAHPVVTHSATATAHTHRLLSERSGSGARAGRGSAGPSAAAGSASGSASSSTAGSSGLFSGHAGTFAPSRALGSAVSGRRHETALGVALLLGAGAANRAPSDGNVATGASPGSGTPTSGAPRSGGTGAGGPSDSGRGPAGSGPGLAGAPGTVGSPFGGLNYPYGAGYPYHRDGQAPGAGSGSAGSGTGSSGSGSSGSGASGGSGGSGSGASGGSSGSVSGGSGSVASGSGSGYGSSGTGSSGTGAGNPGTSSPWSGTGGSDWARRDANTTGSYNPDSSYSNATAGSNPSGSGSSGAGSSGSSTSSSGSGSGSSVSSGPGSTASTSGSAPSGSGAGSSSTSASGSGG